MTHDPIRLLDDVTAPASLRRDLGVAARYRPPYDVGAGMARFEASLARGAGAASSGWGAGALGVGALILGGIIGAGVWLTRPPTPEAEPQAMGAGIAAEALPPVPLEAIAAPLSDRTGEDPADAAVLSERTGEAPVIAPQVPAADAAASSEDVPKDRSEAPPPTEARKARIRRPPAGKDGPPPETPGPGSADYLREARSLQAARGFLGRDPAEALARAEAGAIEFKNGAFAQEWEGVAILALFALDRRGEAERRARVFLDRFPKGPYAAQIREALVRP
ncbi:MAG TPA: hypothetical protein VIK91_26530 [Nannocystis sp.]